MHVYVCICVYVCMNVCVGTYMCMRMCVCTCADVFALCTCTRVCTRETSTGGSKHHRSVACLSSSVNVLHVFLCANMYCFSNVKKSI